MCCVCRHREARLALATYCIFSFSVIGSDELISLWMATKQYRGSLAFTAISLSSSYCKELILEIIPKRWYTDFYVQGVSSLLWKRFIQ